MSKKTSILDDTRMHAVKTFEKGLECMKYNGPDTPSCNWNIAHSCKKCPYNTSDEEWEEALHAGIDALKILMYQNQKRGKE